MTPVVLMNLGLMAIPEKPAGVRHRPRVHVATESPDTEDDIPEGTTLHRTLLAIPWDNAVTVQWVADKLVVCERSIHRAIKRLVQRGMVKHVPVKRLNLYIRVG